MASVCSQNSYTTQPKYIMVPAGAGVALQQFKQIAPNQITSAINMMSSSIGPITNKNYNCKSTPYGEHIPSIARRNARERNRVKQVNNGFTTLRQHIPSAIVSALSSGGRGDSKKLSKVDTLRMAVEYIRGLQDLIEDCDSQGSSIGSLSPLSSSSSYYPAESSPDGFSPQRNTYNSETSASPTPSYNSDVSIGNSNAHHTQFKYEPLDSYDRMTANTPDDDEILDYISLWQEQ